MSNSTAGNGLTTNHPCPPWGYPRCCHIAFESESGTPARRRSGAPPAAGNSSFDCTTSTRPHRRRRPDHRPLVMLSTSTAMYLLPHEARDLANRLNEYAAKAEEGATA